jgi:hypothetical protein
MTTDCEDGEGAKVMCLSGSPDLRPVRLAYQPPASSTFLSEQTSHQQPASSTFLSEQTSTSHQPNEQAVSCHTSRRWWGRRQSCKSRGMAGGGGGRQLARHAGGGAGEGDKLGRVDEAGTVRNDGEDRERRGWRTGARHAAAALARAADVRRRGVRQRHTSGVGSAPSGRRRRGAPTALAGLETESRAAGRAWKGWTTIHACCTV